MRKPSVRDTRMTEEMERELAQAIVEQQRSEGHEVVDVFESEEGPCMCSSPRRARQRGDVRREAASLQIYCVCN